MYKNRGKPHRFKRRWGFYLCTQVCLFADLDGSKPIFLVGFCRLVGFSTQQPIKKAGCCDEKEKN